MVHLLALLLPDLAKLTARADLVPSLNPGSYLCAREVSVYAPLLPGKCPAPIVHRWDRSPTGVA